MKSGFTYQKYYSLLFLLIFFQAAMVAQIKVSGTVKDARTGEALYAVISVKGIKPAVVAETDKSGYFSIMVNSPKDILEIFSSSYFTKEVQVGNQTVLTVAMTLNSKILDNVIVIAYDTKKDKIRTEVTETMELPKLSAIGGGSFDKFVGGNSSIHVTNSGSPGKGASMKLRGISSINANSEPLLVLDGLPLDNAFEIGGISPIFTINPDDIETITILKDAAATAMYGARGANGVLMITTKRGKMGAERKQTVNFSTYVGMSYRPKKFDVMNADQFCTYMNNLYGSTTPPTQTPDCYTPEFRSQNGNVNTDWQDALIQAAPMQNYNLGISAGSQKSNYNLSANYYNEKGILLTTGSERYSIRANSDFIVSKRVKVGESMMASRVNSDLPSYSNPWYIALVNPPIMPIYDSHNIGGYAGPTNQFTAKNDNTNPVAELKLNSLKSQMSRFLIDIYADIELLKGLTYRIDAGYDYSSNHLRSWNPVYELGTKGGRSNAVAKLGENLNFYSMWKLDNIFTYRLSFGSDSLKLSSVANADTAEKQKKIQAMIDDARKNHNLVFMAGHSAQSFSTESFRMEGQGFDFPEQNVLAMATTGMKPNSTNTDYAIESYMARVMYDYKGKYMFTSSLRRDGCSKFGENARWGNFPSFSVGWKLSDDFLEKYKDSTINMVKLRFGWGQTGNQNLNPYRDREYLDPITHARYPFGTLQTVDRGYQLYSSTGNPNLKWETNTMTNIGADFSLFKHRIEFSAEYYIKNQRDMLVQQLIPLSTGRLPDAKPWVNLGEVRNRGFEFNISYRDNIGAKSEDPGFDYNIGANFTTIKNEVISLPNGDIKNTVGNGSTITTPGHTIGSFYGYVAEGIFQSKEEVDQHAIQSYDTRPGDIKFKDLNHDGKIDEFDRTIIGKAVPDFIYGLNFGCSYKHFDFSLFLQGVQNMQIYNGVKATLLLPQNTRDENRLTDVLNAWTPENHSTTVPRVSMNDINNNARFSSFFMEDGSYLRIKNIQLGYTFPESIIKKINVARLRSYVSVTNVWTFTKYTGMDPDIVNSSNPSPLAANFDYGTYPVPRVFMLGLQVEF